MCFVLFFSAQFIFFVPLKFYLRPSDHLLKFGSLARMFSRAFRRCFFYPQFRFGFGEQNFRFFSEQVKTENANLVAQIQWRHWTSLFEIYDGSSATENVRKVSSDEFRQMIANFAFILLNEGITKQSRIAVQMEKSVECIALYLATLQIGAVYLPLNTDYKIHEVSYFVENAAPSLFLTRSKQDAEHYSNALKPTKTKIMDGEELFRTAKKVGKFDEKIEIMNENEMAALLYTSGTTGRPKGAMITHGNLVSNARALNSAWKMTSNDILLHCLPIFHVHGLFVAINSILMDCGRFLFCHKFSPDLVLSLIPKAKVFMGVPTFYTRLLANPKLTPDLCKNMRIFISGSAPLQIETWQKFEAATGHRILERYGMTEAQMICSNPYPPSKRIPGTVGFPLEKIQVRIEKNILQIKGPNIFKGYWGMPEKTKSEFTTDGFFITGDHAEMTEKGYIRLLGRSSDLIISGGLNIYPKEIEICIDEFPEIAESAVFGVPHPDFGETVVAVCVPKNSVQNFDSEKFQNQIFKNLKEKIATFKVPKKIFFSSELPRNSMGKVQKNLLKEKYKNLFIA